MSTEKVNKNPTKEQLDLLELTLKRGKYRRSCELALSTVKVVETYIHSNVWRNTKDLIDWLVAAGKKLAEACISETAPYNITRRVIKLVQDDFVTHSKALPKTLSSIDPKPEPDYTEEIPEIRLEVQTAVRELIFELETSAEIIAEEATKHIHPDDVILTLGKSATVEAFLLKAAKSIAFEVIVCEGAPSNHGHSMAEKLSSHKIPTTITTDASIFALLPFVNKVIIGTHTVLANGGLKAIAGCHALALAAEHYNVPLIVLASLYKLTPEYPGPDDVTKIKNRLVSPEPLLDFAEAKDLEDAQIYNPLFDYVPPELISTFVFNIGSHAPSYIYRLLQDTYPPINHGKPLNSQL